MAQVSGHSTLFTRREQEFPAPVQSEHEHIWLLMFHGRPVRAYLTEHKARMAFVRRLAQEDMHGVNHTALEYVSKSVGGPNDHDKMSAFLLHHLVLFSTSQLRQIMDDIHRGNGPHGVNGYSLEKVDIER